MFKMCNINKKLLPDWLS